MTTVSIVEDHIEYGFVLKDIVESTEGFSVQCIYTSAEEALQKIYAYPSEILIVDLRLPGISGIELIMKLKVIVPDAKIIVCSTHHDNESVFQALKAGALGYLLKDSTPEQIQVAIRGLRDGGSPMSPYIARKVVTAFHKPIISDENNLTAREQEIIELIAQGSSYIDIADLLFISIETVKKHVRNIYKKLQVNNRIAALNKIRKS